MPITPSLVIEVVAAVFTALGSTATILGLRRREHSSPTASLPSIQRALSTVNEAEAAPVYETVSASRHELPTFRKMLVDEFGEVEVGATDLFAKWQKKYPRAIQLIYKTTRGTRNLGGGYKVIPIDNELIFAIDYGGFTAGSAIPEKNVVKPGRVPAGWWVGDLISVNGSNRAVVAALMRFFAENLQPNTRVYARPLTQKGLKLMSSLGFLRVGDLGPPRIGKVCSLYPEDVNKLLARLHAGKPLRTRQRAAATRIWNPGAEVREVVEPSAAMELVLVGV